MRSLQESWRGEMRTRLQPFRWRWDSSHCNEYSKHIFPEMKLLGLVLNFYIHVSGSNFYIPMICLIWNLNFPVLCENSQQDLREKGWELPPSGGRGQFPLLPSASCSLAESSHNWPTYKSPIRKITDNKWKELIPCTLKRPKFGNGP